jgi:hypothetical protein
MTAKSRQICAFGMVWHVQGAFRLVRRRGKSVLRLMPRALSHRPARHDSLAVEDDQAMNEISFAAPEVAAVRQRGIPTDERELWETLRLDAERAAAGGEMLRSFLDLVVLRHDGFASGLGLLLAGKLAEYSMPAERLGEIARAAMAGDPAIIAATTP